MSAPDNTRETHKAGIEAARRAIHSGKGCTCRRGARGDAEDAIDAYLSRVRLVSLDAVLDALRSRHSAILNATAEALAREFGAEDPQP